MIQQSTLTFLEELKENNYKEWFHEHKALYQRARENFLDLTHQLIEQIGEFDEGVLTSNLEPKRCIMRINRDIRFSKDKTPYKTNFFCTIKKGGKKSPYGGYYLSISPNESFIGAGAYMPEKPVLDKIRLHLAQSYDSWLALIQNKDFLKHYPEGVKASGKLTRPPKGYEKDDPAIQYLKFKGFYTQKFLTSQALSSQNMVQEVEKAFRAVHPLVTFLNEGID